MSNVARLLRDAAARIAQEGTWTKGAMARDCRGFELVVRREAQTFTTSEGGFVRARAQCFCSLGALTYSEHEGEHCGPTAREYLSQAISTYLPQDDGRRDRQCAPYTPAEKIMNFNDDQKTTHEEVMAVFKLAEDLAEADNA